jgi:streptogramin lyase
MNDEKRSLGQISDWLAASAPPRSADRVIDAVLDALPATAQESGALPVPLFARLKAIAMLAATLGVGTILIVVFVLRPWSGPAAVPTASPSAPTATPTPTSTIPSSAGPASLAPGVIAAIDMGIDTWSLAIDEKSVWVQVGDVGIGRIDRATNLDTGIRVAEVPAMTFADGKLWALDVGTGITQLNPLNGVVLRTLPGISGYYIAVDGTTAWVTDVGHSVDRIDLRTGTVMATIDVPAGPKKIAVFDGAVWVACDAGGVVARIDIATNKVVAKIPAGERPVNLAVGEGAVWAWNHGQQLLRIDPKTNAVAATIDGVAPTLGVGVVVGGGSVWVAVPSGIGRIDPATNDIVEVLPLGQGDYVDLAWFDGELWASSVGRNLVYRIQPD